MDWIKKANCLDKTKLFFSGIKEEIDEAKRLCSLCSVQYECLEYAMSTHQDFGIWGGLNAKQRSNLQVKRLISLPHSKQHEHTHPASASLSYLGHTSDLKTHTPEALQTPVVFRILWPSSGTPE
jgi:WhiB family redox-sensing transcriptional regulator